MGGWSIRAVSIAVAVILPLFAASVLLPTMAGMSTYVAASAGIALVAATMGLAAGCAAVVLACCVAVLVEMAPVGEVVRTHDEDLVAELEHLDGSVQAIHGELELGVQMTRYTLRRFGVSTMEAEAIAEGLRGRSGRPWPLDPR